MAKTRLITVDGTTDVAVTAFGMTRSIEIGEDPSAAGWPSGDFLVKKPAAADQARQIPAGQIYRFTLTDAPASKMFEAGQIVGYIKMAAAGTTTFFVDEKEV